MVEDTYQRMLQNGTGTYSRDVVETAAVPRQMMLSPFTPRVNQSAARLVEQEAWNFLDQTNPLCGQRWRKSGNLLTEEGENCWDAASGKDTPESYLQLDNVFYYDNFQDGSRVCQQEGGGRFYKYDPESFTLSCIPCPPNSFRGPQGPARDHCVPCDLGTTAVAG